MKIAVVILVLLGTLAAGAAVVLIQAVGIMGGGDRAEREVPRVSVLVADANLPARTRITREHVKIERVAQQGLPAGYLVDSAQAIGKVLRVPVLEGQALAGNLFQTRDSIDDLLRPGMRAFPITLGGRSTPIDLLYPGAIVDVFVTFALRGRESSADAVVVPLLQRIQVLGIAGRTVMSSQEAQQGGGSRSSGSGSVTLEVTPVQVAALQLAIQGGTLGLAMRNPTDEGWESMEPLSRRGARMSVDPETMALLRRIHETLGGESSIDPESLEVEEAPAPVTAQPVLPAFEPVAAVVPGAGPRSSTRTVTVIRAQDRKETEVEGENAENGQEGVQQGAGNNR